MTTTTSRGSLLLLAIAACALLPGPSLAQGDKPQCRLNPIAALPLQYTGSELDVTVEGSIHGTPATFLVGTQVNVTMLTMTGAGKRGLKLEPMPEDAAASGGAIGQYVAYVSDLAIGPIRMGRTGLTAVDFSPSYDAIAGAAFLFQTDLEISLPDKKLKFFKPSGCDNAFLGYWPDGAIDVPIQYDLDRDQGPSFPVKLNGHMMRAVINTGTPFSLVHLDAAKRIGLRLDAPGITRLPDATGVGTRPIPRWRANFDELSIGDETIRSPRLDIIDTNGARAGHQIVLGVDFLRAHRVLFALSQRKLYLSYTGDPVLEQSTGIEPWLQREADSGNAHAQLRIATMYREGKDVPANKEKARDWLNRAAAGSHAAANPLAGVLLREGRYGDAVARLKSAQEKLGPDRTGALYLYLARLPGGDLESAKRELETAFASDRDAWPGPVANFFLGRIDSYTLLKQAKTGRKGTDARGCEATVLIADWHAVRGETERARALLQPLREAKNPVCGEALQWVF